MNPIIHKGNLNAGGLRFAIIESRWNDLITSRLVNGLLDSLESLGAKEDNIEIYKVPGSFELPSVAKKVAETQSFDAVICVGVVIRGETPHFDYVAGEAASGISSVGRDLGIPVVFCVLTTDTVEQAMNRAGIKSGNKGFEAGFVAVEMANLFKEIENTKRPENRKVMPKAV